jgi:hypothetical protein
MPTHGSYAHGSITRHCPGELKPWSVAFKGTLHLILLILLLLLFASFRFLLCPFF